MLKKTSRYIGAFLVFALFTLLSCGEAQSKNDEPTKDWKASDIIKLIKKGKPVQIVDAVIFDDLDFTQVDDMYLTSGTTLAVDVQVPIYFRNCIFLGKVVSKSKVNDKAVCVSNFRRTVTFATCDFRDDVDFTRSLFIDNVDFSQSIFRGVVNFDMSTMRGEQNRFYEIECETEFSLVATKCNGSITLMDGKFSGGLRLQSLVAFNLNLNNIVVKGESQISDMTLKGVLMANYADFGTEANLSYSKFFSNVSMCHSRTENHMDMSYCEFKSPSKINDCMFSTLNLEKVLFYQAPEFVGTKVLNLGDKPMYYRIIASEKVDFKSRLEKRDKRDSTNTAAKACCIDELQVPLDSEERLDDNKGKNKSKK